MIPLRLWSLLVLSLVAVIAFTACDEGLPETDSTPSENEPLIVLDPPNGLVDTEVVVHGSNFPPETVVNIYIGEASAGVIPEEIMSASTDELGEFNAVVSIPSQWPNGDPVVEQTLIVAAISQDYASTGMAHFSVQPGGETTSPVLSVFPDSGTPGDTVQISGEDFLPNTQIVLQIGVPQSGLNEDSLAIVTTDENGQFEIEIQLPYVWPDSELPVIEETLIIGAVDQEAGQTLATDTFENESAGEEITPEPEPNLPPEEDAPTELPTWELDTP